MNSSKGHKLTYIHAGIIALLAGISMIAFPGVVLRSAQQGINLWTNYVLPALLPFFICSDFMISLGIPHVIGMYFEKVFRKAFGVPGSSGFVFIVSITSGYPMGAKAIDQMRKNNDITDFEGVKMLSFCSTSGPLFILGVVGAGMLKSSEAGAVIALSHYISAIVNGILFSMILGRKGEKNNAVRAKTWVSSEKNANITEMLTASILSSLKALGIICCYIVIFTYITDLIEMSGLLSIFKDSYSKGLIKGLIEITVGLNEMSQSNLINLRLKTAIAAFLVSFGGISIIAQSMGVMSNLKVNPLIFLSMKLSHAFIAGTLALFLAPSILDNAVLNVALIDDIYSCGYFGFLMQLLFSTKMIIMILLIFLFMVTLEILFFRRKDTDIE